MASGGSCLWEWFPIVRLPRIPSWSAQAPCCPIRNQFPAHLLVMSLIRGRVLKHVHWKWCLNWIIMEMKLTTKYYQKWIATVYLSPVIHLALVRGAIWQCSLGIFNHQYWSAPTLSVCLVIRNFQVSAIYFLKPLEWQVLWKTLWHFNCTSEIETCTGNHNLFFWRHFWTACFDL